MHGSYVRGTTDRNYPPWADKIVTTCMSYLTTGGLIRNRELASYHQLEEFGKGQNEREDSSPFVLPTSQNPFWLESPLVECCTHHQEGLCVRMIGQRTRKPTHNRKT